MGLFRRKKKADHDDIVEQLMTQPRTTGSQWAEATTSPTKTDVKVTDSGFTITSASTSSRSFTEGDSDLTSAEAVAQSAELLEQNSDLLRKFGVDPTVIQQAMRDAVEKMESTLVGEAATSSIVIGQPNDGGDLVHELERLTQLHAGGALSDAEFAAAKAKLLGSQ